MSRLDPRQLFERLSSDIPQALHERVFVAGSLAAAHHFQAKLEGRAINTKDADLVVHPTGDASSCRAMAEKLLELGWRPTRDCYPQVKAEPVQHLRAIRLYPPSSTEYFIEFLNVPEEDQGEVKRWIPVELSDGWYGLPTFRFLGVASIGRKRSHVGLEYASPAMMALANLLSHSELGTARIESGDLRGVLRSAKDLGRVLALARLEGREEVENWRDSWAAALRQCFPRNWKSLAGGLGTGLQELLTEGDALEAARKTTDMGLLHGHGVSVEMLRATGERLLQDVIRPLRDQAR